MANVICVKLVLCIGNGFNCITLFINTTHFFLIFKLISVGTVGFVYAWDGNKQAGKGEQEITNLIENERVEVEVRFEKPFKGLASTPFILQSESAETTKITWGMKSSMNYPMNIVLLLMNMEKILGKDLTISLENLKNILEKKNSSV